MIMGQGCEKSMTAARKGTKTTEDPIREPDRRGSGRYDESLAIPRTANAINAFQKAVSENDGVYQSPERSSPNAAAAIAMRRRRKLHLSSLGDWFSPIRR